MREAALTVTIDHDPEAEQRDIATAGADAERAQIVAWLRADSRRWIKLCLEASPEGQRVMRAIIEELREKADAIEAGQHWGADDGQ